MAQFVSLENPAKRTLRGINDDLLKSATTRPNDYSFPLFACNDRETFIFLTKYRIKYWSEHFIFRLLLIWVFLTDGFGNFGGFFFCFFLRFLNTCITFMAVSFYFNCLYKIVGKSCNIVIIWILLSEWLKNSTTKKATHTHKRNLDKIF